jgi:hypothetical protein
MQVPVQPYRPYRMITPKRAEAQNLLEPVCFSASHVAYSTLRMEPQYMIIGQAAGIAARMAVRGNSSVQEIDQAALARTLVRHGQSWNTRRIRRLRWSIGFGITSRPCRPSKLPACELSARFQKSAHLYLSVSILACPADRRTPRGPGPTPKKTRPC